jgi:hypothetical protein
MIDRVLRRGAANEERGLPNTGRSPLILAMVMIGIIGVAIVIDAYSEPALAVLSVVAITGLIAALAAWG